HAALVGKSKEEIEVIRADYEREFHHSLDQDVDDNLSGRDLFNAKLELRGEPKTAKEALDRFNERRLYERGGVINALSRSQIDQFSDSGTRLDETYSRANALYEMTIRK